MKQYQSKKQLLIGNALGQFGSSILSFVLGLHILKIMESVFLYGVSQMIGPLVAIMLLPILGSIIDKYSKTTIIRISQLASCFALLGFVLSSHSMTPHYAQIIFLLIILKLSDQFLSTTLNAATMALVKKDEVQRFRAHLQLIQAASMMLSPIVAVLLFDKLPLLSMLWLELLIECLVLAIYWSIDFQQEQKEDDITQNQGLWSLFKEGLHFIVSYQKLLFGLFFVLMINAVLGILNVGLPFVQIKQLGLSPQAYALNDSVLAFGLLLGSLLASKIRPSSHLNTARYAISIVALATVLLGLLFNLTLSKTTWSFILMAYFFTVGFSITLCNVLMSSWSILKIPQTFQGRVFAVLNALTQVSLPVSMLLFGLLFDVMDTVLIFTVSGIVLLIMTILVPWLFRINLANDQLE